MPSRVLPLAVLLLSSCSEDLATTPSEPRTVAVLFTYTSPVPRNPPPPTDPDLAGAALGCAHHYSALGGVYVLEGSWGDGARLRNPNGDCHEGCSFVATAVPVDTEHVLRAWDLKLCNVSPREEPLSFRVLAVNGVELTRTIDHPSGMRGAAFRVSATGRVTP